MKIAVTNESTERVGGFYYDVDYTIGDKHGADTLYFHAFYNRENPTTECRDYVILPKVSGKGRFLGCNIGVIANKELYYTTWWGEGEVKVYLDGDNEYPTLCGTGTEDYIGTGWGQGRYVNLYQGCHLADFEKMQYCFYRYHIPDPVYFHKDVRVTIQQIGYWDSAARAYLYYQGTPVLSTRNKLLDLSKSGSSERSGIYERCDDWSGCAYFYLNSPVNDLPELAPPEDRIK